MTTTKKEPKLMTVTQRGAVMVPSLHDGGECFAAANIAIGERDHPNPLKVDKGTVFDWTEPKSKAGRDYNRRLIQQHACKKTKINDKLIPLLVGPVERRDPEKPLEPKKALFTNEMSIREVITIIRKESKLELIPMDVKSYVRWDGKCNENDGIDPLFMPGDFELLSCASKRDGDQNVQMGRQSLQMVELYLNGSTSAYWELSNRKRGEPMLGFQVPREDIFLGKTCTERLLSKREFVELVVKAETGIKLYGSWKITQELIVKEHQLQDPNIGVYEIPVLHVKTVIAKVCLGDGIPISIGMKPDQCEINAFWIDMFVHVAGKAMKEVWMEDETWKGILWDEPMAEDRKKNLSSQIRSRTWFCEFKKGSRGGTAEKRMADMEANETDFLFKPRPMAGGVYSGIPIAQMLVMEYFEQMKKVKLEANLVGLNGNEESPEMDDKKPAAKRSNEQLVGSKKKKRCIGNEVFLEEGTVGKARGFAE